MIRECFDCQKWHNYSCRNPKSHEYLHERHPSDLACIDIVLETKESLKLREKEENEHS